MRTFLTLALRCICGDWLEPEYPGFCMPRPSAGLARGFFKLERNGERVTEPSNVEPFETLVNVVFIDIKLPWPFVPTGYGRPDESVTETAADDPESKGNGMLLNRVDILHFDVRRLNRQFQKY